MPVTLALNGQNRCFENLTSPTSLVDVIAELNLKGDRIAVEHNGGIVERARWSQTWVSAGDRLEVVHFVGGGTSDPPDTLHLVIGGLVGQPGNPIRMQCSLEISTLQKADILFSRGRVDYT